MIDSDNSYDYASDPGSDISSFSTEGDEPCHAPQHRSRTFTVIGPVQIAQSQEHALGSVMSILNCSRSNARNLLIFSRWNTETLFGALADKGEDYVFQAAGLSMGPASRRQPTPGEEVSCATCFCDGPIEEATSMDCGHWFCNDCWKSHLAVQIREGMSRRLKCMAFKCGTHCDEDKVKRLIQDDVELLEKYQSNLLSSYIEDNAMVKWCPSVPHCGNAIRVESDPHCEPTCSCGFRFCFACGNEAHSPCTCEMWRQWNQKSQDDSETKHWLTANTKTCPKCSKSVEKNGGCNLVTCRCGQSFCWLCGVATGRSHTYAEIFGHSCGRYKEDADRKIDEAARNIKRYQHYYSRWESHVKSAELEGQQRTKIHDKIEVLEQSKSTLKDYTWLLQALDQLFNARKILGYSYAFAFFMFGNRMFAEEINSKQNEINTNLFENQQQELESLVEHLSKILEMSPEQMEEVEDSLRLEVINHTVSLDKRLEKLYELIENDLLGSLTFSSNYIAPYKGCSLLNSKGNGQLLATAQQDDIINQSTSDDVVDLSPSSTPSPESRNLGKRPRIDPARHRTG